MQKLFYAVAAFIIIHSSLSISKASAQSVQIYRSGTAVGAPHSTLASAIAAAINGDSLDLSGHTFFEHDLLINKNLIFGGSRIGSPTIIDAQELGRVLRVKSRNVSLYDITLTNGDADMSSYLRFLGGGILVDTPGVLTLNGATIVDKNKARQAGGGIFCNYKSNFPVNDSIVLKLKGNTVISNNQANTGAGINSRNINTKLYLFDNCLIQNNSAQVFAGGVDAGMVSINGIGTEGGIRIVNNTALNGGGFCADSLYLWSELNVNGNVADSFGGGFGYVHKIAGKGKLLVWNNRAKYGGGAVDLNTFDNDSSEVLIYNNRAMYGGGLTFYGSGRHHAGITSVKNIEIFNNIADSCGGAIYISGNVFSTRPSIKNLNIHNNSAARYNGIYVLEKTTHMILFISDSRIFNPLPSGAQGPEIALEGTTPSGEELNANGCWFGKSDTTGLIYRGPRTIFKMDNWVVCDWLLNKGLPISWMPFPLNAKFRLNTGDSLVFGSFPMLEGRFSGTMGIFSPAISPMKTINEIESIYTATSTGSASIMGIVDADTFKANLTVSSIKEIGFEQVKIFPNPATDVIYLQGVEAGSSIELYDITGKLLKKEKLMNTNAQVDIKSFSAGIFNLKITNKAGQIGNAKVVKQ